jgi:hypothetical protein
MAKTIPVEVRVADLPDMQRFINTAYTLLSTMGRECGDLPGPVIAEADQLWRDLTTLIGRDIGPRPGTQAQDHPGRTITR